MAPQSALLAEGGVEISLYRSCRKDKWQDCDMLARTAIE